jgi:hypothetical protein
MTVSAQQLQLAALALIVSLITVGSFTYILWKQPESLRLSRDGVPFFTPQVIHPDTGEIISVDELVEHFKKEG